MKVNTRAEAGLLDPDTGEYFELDIYLPSLQLAFEYQVQMLSISPLFAIMLTTQSIVKLK